MPLRNIAVFVSGGGSNLQALLEAEAKGRFTNARIAVVFSDRPDAPALERARKFGCETAHISPHNYTRREDFDQAIFDLLKGYPIALICLAGYLKIISPILVRAYPRRIMNIHPALLPDFGGKGLYGHHVHEAVLRSGVKVSGCTVHFVDEGTDTGPIILQQRVQVFPDDTPADLAGRILHEEHLLYPRAVELWSQEKLRIEGGVVKIV